MSNFKLSLTDIQKEAVRFCLKNPYAIVALQMGLGKSAVAIYLAHRLKSRCLIIAPAGLILNWKHEIEKCLDGQLITLFRKGSDIYSPFDSDFVLISYDLAIKSEAIFEWADMVIFDEANHLSHMNTKRTSRIHELIYENSIPRMYLLTGTPIKNRVEEYYSLITLCNYNPQVEHSEFLVKFPESISFADHFSYRDEFQKPIYRNGNRQYITIRKWEGLRNEEELREWLRDIYIMRKGQTQSFIRKEVILSEEDNPDLLKEFNRAMDDIGHSVESKFKKEAALKKVPLTVKYLKDLFETGEITSAVVFTDHRASCHELARAFGTIGITGEMPVAERQRLAKEFQAGVSDVIVGTIKALSTGYTLTRANNVVFNDFPWVPGDMEQAEFRINRIGQTKQCVVHRIIGSKQDEYILRVIENKKEVITKMEEMK